MSHKFIFIAFLAIYSVSVISGHNIVKRQTLEVTDNLVSATHQWTNYFANTWNTLRNSLNVSDSEAQSRLHQIRANLTNWRNSLANASSDISEELVARLQNMTNHLNTVLRERSNNDQNLVHRLYDMIINATTNGTNQSTATLRRAFTTATQTMAENYSGLANSSLQLASDMRDKGSELFNNAMIRAGNDTNRAVIAVNTAINAIRNSSEPINETVQWMATNLTQSVQKLSAQLRNLINETRNDTNIESIGSEFRGKAQQSLQKLMSSMNQLRNSLSQFSTNTDNSVEDNEIDVIGKASKALSREYANLENQLNALRTQNDSLNNNSQ